ncbi:BREX-2 system adenine-specific DNA-methyltransferase PglX [Thermobifida halotolerans]|uniref:site-specific DNA-methyltransferase (adenine-specific) n=1 Tax=Thermobifida halotolerans TaxID=483545 RepID=A0A399G6P8_9ACTN|nr:BREX-2 system adenine-specific DNA-methyltransferase PglX [Thermobifida halotolerans]UOE18453.1 BREX-2 system adenine-specific DNA-methyltransferase PglX [Thermobifida halotolerans]
MAGRRDRGGLLDDLRQQVTLLEDDLRARSGEDECATVLEEEYREALEAQRTAAAYRTWRDERVTQVAAAWVLGTLFVRFCEDNGLIEQPWIAGPGDRLDLAESRHQAFSATAPNLGDRDWLVAAFIHLAKCHRTTEGLFNRSYNPLWQITPSHEAAGALLRFWRRRGPDGGPVHVFTDPDLDTRFLGDLYQDLSEHARKTYALLRTPGFVEEFVLDLTLEPAIEEFGLDPELEVHDSSGEVAWRHRGLRTIDPACGSGQFLLGLFTRILARHREAAGPEADDWELVRKTLESVHGCDKNPFAVGIARFRLLVAVLRETGTRRLDQAPDFPLHVAVGDSLLHGRGVETIADDLLPAGRRMFAYTTEDVWEHSRRVDLLGSNSYHVVVADPPYTTVRDKQENANYRSAYDVCSGSYALSVPFAQRMFGLATREHAGFTGQITANSFMKREFGRRLIEDFFGRKVKLTHVIDTSGAFVPGHGAPTVILVGRNTIQGWADPIREVLGVRGEPSPPEDPAQGLVWRSIVENVHRPGIETSWVSVRNGDRDLRITHPWSLSGGGADELRRRLESAPERLSDRVAEIGFGGVLREDCAYMVGEAALERARIGAEHRRPVVEGDSVRDFRITDAVVSLWPYSAATLTPALSFEAQRLLWPRRTLLRNRSAYGSTQLERGLTWYEYSTFPAERYRVPLSITYGETATHNHFVLDRGGKVFKQTAPVVKLPEGATEEDHLRLLGVLNSSTACFWLKQVSQGRSGGGPGRTLLEEAWEERYQFTPTKLHGFPLPTLLPLDLGRALDSLAREAASHEPSAAVAGGAPTRGRLAEARAAAESVRRRMIALQEELDWQVYGLYGLLSDAEAAAVVASDPSKTPEISLGERAFEIVLARQIAVGDSETAWFSRHGSTPVTELPRHWPEEYRRVVQARIDLIEKRRDLALVERPECKRRWAEEPWEGREAAALRSWLLNRCERRDLWFVSRDGRDDVPRAMILTQLADALAHASDGDDVVTVAEWYAADHLGRPGAPLVEVLERLVADQHVPYLAAHRYRPSGLRKRARWEQVWAQQREEDRTGRRLDIPVPPRYTSADFRQPSYWALRGRLDVPRERFVSYPDAAPSGGPALVVGWAGWDHAQRAEALMDLVEAHSATEDRTRERITPLLAGVHELLPWLRQWHGSPGHGGGTAERTTRWLADQQERHHLSEDHLTTWRPA